MSWYFSVCINICSTKVIWTRKAFTWSMILEAGVSQLGVCYVVIFIQTHGFILIGTRAARWKKKSPPWSLNNFLPNRGKFAAKPVSREIFFSRRHSLCGEKGRRNKSQSSKFVKVTRARGSPKFLLPLFFLSVFLFIQTQNPCIKNVSQTCVFQGICVQIFAK